MILQVGAHYLVEPKCGPLGGQEFIATLVDIRGDECIVRDQNDDHFTVDRDEIKHYNGITEQQRRDEKNGLYGEHIDVAN